jgi:methionyl-tRNA synthetase
VCSANETYIRAALTSTTCFARYEPRYVEPDTARLKPDTRPPPVQPVKVTVDERFYITTAINYTNGKPHIGHAYEAVTADVLARYHRIAGREVFFLTGSDEHGKKVQQSAAQAGLRPIEVADMYSAGFQALNAQLKVSNDRYVRTSEREHVLTAQMVFQKADDNGDIYLRNYEGWYDVREERFVPDAEAELSHFADKHGQMYERQSEASYHFKMGKYQQQLVDHIKAHPDFIQPETQRNLILSRLEQPLLDLCASRPVESLQWGIPLPADEGHVMYVWFDALTNYLTGVNYRHEADLMRAKFWPCSVHIVGRDIMWFHCVVWPCMLLSAGIPLPTTVFGHGWVLAGDAEKMSKSLGNVVDPVALLARFPSDTLRSYLVEEATYGQDMSFQLENMIERHNVQLADTLGNVVHRVCCLAVSMQGGAVPHAPAVEPRPFDLDELRTACEAHMRRFELREYARHVWDATRAVNGWIYKMAPWKIKGEDRIMRTGPVLRAALEALYILAHFFAPLIPDAVAAIEVKLGTRLGTLPGLRVSWDNLSPGTLVDPRAILFAKIATAP